MLNLRLDVYSEYRYVVHITLFNHMLMLYLNFFFF